MSILQNIPYVGALQNATITFENTWMKLVIVSTTNRAQIVKQFNIFLAILDKSVDNLLDSLCDSTRNKYENMIDIYCKTHAFVFCVIVLLNCHYPPLLCT